MLDKLFVKPDKIIKINNDKITKITKVSIKNNHYFRIEDFEKNIALGIVNHLIFNGVIKKA